ncbi:MAG: potassium channel family protein [Planctomycetota bacterium]
MDLLDLDLDDPLLGMGERRRRRTNLRRFVVLLWVVPLVASIGTVGYMIEGLAPIDSLYMTVITMSTVGFGEVQELGAGARVFTIFLIIISLGIVGYSLTALAAFLLEGELHSIIKGRRMNRRISGLSDHIIVCGCGNTGRWIAEEFHNTSTPFVIIDQDQAAVESWAGERDVPAVFGDATDDMVLESAGIKRAHGLVAALAEDKDNVYVALSARAFNAELRIISRVVDEENAGKLIRAGANQVVSPNRIGGLRIASAMVRPSVVGFLDRMLYSRESVLRLEDVLIAQNSAMVGRSLRELDLGRKTGVMIVAVRGPNDEFLFNPGGDNRIDSDSVLVALGSNEQIAALRRFATGREQ